MIIDKYQQSMYDLRVVISKKQQNSTIYNKGGRV
jgi:hypothetical protein